MTAGWNARTLVAVSNWPKGRLSAGNSVDTVDRVASLQTKFVRREDVTVLNSATTATERNHL